MKKGIVFISIIFSLVGYANAQQGSSLLSFDGKVYLGLDQENKGKKVKISLYKNNDNISTYTTNYTGKFLLDIERNKHYTVVFEKEGYVSKNIIIRSYANPNEIADLEEFKFDVVLLKKDSGANFSNLDFPVALIEFNKRVEKFDYNKEYSENLVKFRKYLSEKKTDLADN